MIPCETMFFYCLLCLGRVQSSSKKPWLVILISGLPACRYIEFFPTRYTSLEIYTPMHWSHKVLAVFTTSLVLEILVLLPNPIASKYLHKLKTWSLGFRVLLSSARNVYLFLPPLLGNLPGRSLLRIAYNLLLVDWFVWVYCWVSDWDSKSFTDASTSTCSKLGKSTVKPDILKSLIFTSLPDLIYILSVIHQWSLFVLKRLCSHLPLQREF